jgi:uncharacterized protein (DUF342 family)
MTEQQEDFSIRISPDCMSATLGVCANSDISAATVIAALREMKFAAFDDGCVIETLDKRSGTAISIVIATGIPAIDERPARIDYRIPVADGVSRSIARVEAGQLVANLSPAIAGVDGRDVFGKVIPHRKGDAPQIGRGLSLVKGELISTSQGNVRLYGNLLSVEPLLELVENDVDTLPINFDGDAFTKGSVRGGRIIQVSGSLTVGGAMEAIQLKAGGAVNVKGGVIGRQKGKFVVGADLRCRFISGGLLIVGGDLLVQSEITDSRITCIGRVSVAHGPIFGGLIAANSGISCTVLGNANGTPTIVEAGDGLACRSFIASTKALIEANQKRVAEVRSKIEPLLQKLKHLNAMQKEKATELLYEAGELEAQTRTMAAGLEDQIRLYREKSIAEIEVKKAVMPGVTIRFAGVETTLQAALRGPCTLATRKTGSSSEIVVIDGIDHSQTVLPSRAVKTDELTGDTAAPKSKAA